MKTTTTLLAVLLAAASLPSQAAPASAGTVSATPALEPAGGFYDTWIKDRLTLGLGIAGSILTDPKRPENEPAHKTFVGFIYKLDNEDPVYVLPEIRYWASRNLRVTLSRDYASGRTRNYNTPTRHSDGNVEVSGPQLLVEGLWPMCDDTVFLHAGGGVVYDFGDFHEDRWWNLGYSDKESWAYYGSPSDRTANGDYREIHVDDSFGVTLAVGVSWRPAARFEVDLSLRHTWLEPDCEFGYRDGGHHHDFKSIQGGDFTLDHLTVALTGSYVF